MPSFGRGCRKSLFSSLGKFENMKYVFKFVLIEQKGNPDGSLSNYPSLRKLGLEGFLDRLQLPPRGKLFLHISGKRRQINPRNAW